MVGLNSACQPEGQRYLTGARPFFPTSCSGWPLGDFRFYALQLSRGLLQMDLFRSPLADYHISQGATLGEYRGAMVPTRFSDPVAEHNAVRTAVGLFDGLFRAKFALTGRDSVKFLHRIVSNDVKKLAPGQGVYATLLNPKGQILVDMYIYAAEGQ